MAALAMPRQLLAPDDQLPPLGVPRTTGPGGQVPVGMAGDPPAWASPMGPGGIVTGPGGGGPLASGAGGMVPGGDALASLPGMLPPQATTLAPGAPGAPGAPLAGVPPYAPPNTTGRSFTGTAPAPTPYGDFTGPDPNAVSSDPYYKFRAHEGEQAIQRSAAAHGTLLNGGTLKSLEGYRQGLASEEAGHAFDRALSSYTTNRETNQQNYGQGQTSFHGNLDAFNANTNAAGVYGRLDAEKAAAAAGTAADTAAAQQQQRQTETSAMTAAGAQAAQQGAATYAAQVDSARRQNEATSAFGRLPASKGFFDRQRPVLR